MKIHLIDGAKYFHRLWSVRMAILGTIYASAASAWLLLPADWKPDLSETVRWVLAVIGVLLAAAPGITRVIAQPKLAPSCATVPDDSAEHA